MRRWMTVVAMTCAGAMSLALPALAGPAAPSAPDGGSDYVLEAGPVVQHAWNPGAAGPGSGLAQSAAMGQSEAFSSGASSGKGSLSAAHNVVKARRLAKSHHVKQGKRGRGGSSGGSVGGLDWQGLYTALGGGGLDFAKAGHDRPSFELTDGKDGQSINCKLRRGGRDEFTIPENNPRIVSKDRTFQLISFDRTSVTLTVSYSWTGEDGKKHSKSGSFVGKPREAFPGRYGRDGSAQGGDDDHKGGDDHKRGDHGRGGDHDRGGDKDGGGHHHGGGHFGGGGFGHGH